MLSSLAIICMNKILFGNVSSLEFQHQGLQKEKQNILKVEPFRSNVFKVGTSWSTVFEVETFLSTVFGSQFLVHPMFVSGILSHLLTMLNGEMWIHADYPNQRIWVIQYSTHR